MATLSIQDLARQALAEKRQAELARAEQLRQEEAVRLRRALAAGILDIFGIAIPDDEPGGDVVVVDGFTFTAERSPHHSSEWVLLVGLSCNSGTDCPNTVWRRVKSLVSFAEILEAEHLCSEHYLKEGEEE